MSAQELEISYWSSARPTIDDYRLVRAAGFTHAFLDENHFPRSDAAFDELLHICAKADLQAYVFNYNSAEIWHGDRRDYARYRAFAGMIFWDEPSAKAFPLLHDLAVEFSARFPGKTFYVNLLPMYAMLFDTKKTLFELFGVEDYESYLRAYCEQVLRPLSGRRILSIDFYPLCHDPATGESHLEDSWLVNLALASRYADAYGAELFLYIQSCAFGAWRREPKRSDFLLQFYVSLAYGARGINHFTYSTPASTPQESYEPALVDRDNRPTERYFLAQEFNHYFRRLSKTLFAYRRAATVVLAGSEPLSEWMRKTLARLPSPGETLADPTISSIYPVVVGEFEREGKKAYLIVNYTDPSEGKTNRVRFVFPRPCRLYEQEVSQCRWDIALAPGEGCLLLEA